jgi:hypothetical protein
MNRGVRDAGDRCPDAGPFRGVAGGAKTAGAHVTRVRVDARAPAQVAGDQAA